MHKKMKGEIPGCALDYFGIVAKKSANCSAGSVPPSIFFVI